MAEHTTLNIAHRGARSLAPENTLAAARKALEAGADMWELDVTLTRDGELIVIHDDTLERTSDAREVFPHRQPWAVSSFSLDEIRRLDFGSWFVEQDPFGQIAAGNVSAEDQRSYVGEPAPTLRQALAFTRDNGWRVNVEMKKLPEVKEAALAEKAVGLIEELGMVDRVLVSSFEHGYLKRVKALNRDIAIAVLTFFPIEDPAAYLASLDADAYHPNVSSITGDEIRALCQQGYDVNVWTVNDERTMRMLIEAGASGIATDFPQVLAPILQKYRGGKSAVAPAEP